MKKPVSIILSSLMLASALTACAPAKAQLDPAITLASSDAETYAVWLTERLDVVPDDVVLGIGSSESYGIDMSNFQEEGYIMREMDGDVLIFGADADGLDRAVRKYAKAAEDGQTANLDETYHEGERIKKLTIAGTDISEYTVVYNHDRDSNDGALRVVTQTLGNAQYAANELVRLIEQACGTVLPIATEDVDGPMFKLDYITDGSYDKNGFTYEVKDGNVYINGAPEANGVANGVYYFLQTECGWEDLVYGDSVLAEADHIDIPEGASAQINPMFDYTHMREMYYDHFDSDRRDINYRGMIPQPGHSIERWVYVVYQRQLCYTSESNYMNLSEKVWVYLNNLVNSGSIEHGVDYIQVDLGQPDAFGYCLCKDCSKVYKEENYANSGAMIRFCNRLSDEMAQDFENVFYTVFAYHGSNSPCKTVPNDNIYITFCTDGACMRHTLDGGDCFSRSFDMAGLVPGMDDLNNFDYAEWIKGWCEISDNIYIWYYALDNFLNGFTMLKLMYDDITFFHEVGAAGYQPQQDYTGWGIGRVQFQLMMSMQFNPDITEAEYWAELDRLLAKEYGEGSHYIREYINIWHEAMVREGACGNCWGYSKIYSNVFDAEYYIENFDYMMELLDNAIALADTADQERHCELLSTAMIYTGCIKEYFRCYDAGDDARIEVLTKRYSTMIERIKKHGFDLNRLQSQDHGFLKLYENIDDMAWISWLGYRNDLSDEGVEQRPMPDKWAEYYATSTEANS